MNKKKFLPDETIKNFHKNRLGLSLITASTMFVSIFSSTAWSMLEEGDYIIRSRSFLNEKVRGYLSWTRKESGSGHYAQVLADKSDEDKDRYMFPQSTWRDHVIWNISKAEDGSYIIKSRSFLNPKENVHGYLSWTQKTSNSGRYAQVFDHKAEENKDRYLPEATWRNDVLWDISQAENGSYTIRNRDFDTKGKRGYLSWTWEESGSGYYAQVLGIRSDDDQDYYLKGAKWRNDILWELIKVQ